MLLGLTIWMEMAPKRLPYAFVYMYVRANSNTPNAAFISLIFCARLQRLAQRRQWLIFRMGQRYQCLIYSAHSSSAGDMRFHLQNLLDSKEKQLQQAGTLGQRVLAQQMELEERIRQLQEADADKGEDDELDAEATGRYPANLPKRSELGMRRMHNCQARLDQR